MAMFMVSLIRKATTAGGSHHGQERGDHRPNDALGQIEWEVSVDDTVVRAHQHAAQQRRAWRAKKTIGVGSVAAELRIIARG
jgi:hypothetical protein